MTATAWMNRGARPGMSPWRRAVGVAAGTAGTVARVVLAALRLVWGVTPAVLISVGAWMAWEPAGLMVGGVLLLVDRVWDELRERAG